MWETPINADVGSVGWLAKMQPICVKAWAKDSLKQEPGAKKEINIKKIIFRTKSNI